MAMRSHSWAINAFGVTLSQPLTAVDQGWNMPMETLRLGVPRVGFLVRCVGRQA
jgi:hypothetical protein